MAISPLPEAPSTTDPANFDTEADAFVAALSTFRTEANALAAGMDLVAAGGATTIEYVFSTTTTDADPGNGFLRLDSATQNAATTIRADLVGTDGNTWTAFLDTFAGSTSVVKGHILLQSASDGTKFLLFTVSALASPSGYRNITVAAVASSATSPFSNGESIFLKFARTGDAGTGNAPLTVVTATGAAAALLNTNINSSYNVYDLEVSGTISVNSENVFMRVELGGSVISTSTYLYHSQVSSTSATSYSADAAGSGAPGSAIALGSCGNGASNSFTLRIRITNPSSTALTKILHWDGASTRTELQTWKGWGVNTGTSALTGIQIYPGSGTITCTMRLYGRPNS